MIIPKKHIKFIVIFCGLLFFVYYGYTIIQSKELIKESIFPILNKTLKSYIETEKTNYYFVISNYVNEPEKLGQYIERKARFADTTFTYRSKIVDYETHIYRGTETLLLVTGKLSADTINIIFDSICHSHNIYAKSSIGVTADFYKKVNLLSRDTTEMTVNFRTGLYNQGNYEDIDYNAYIEITPYTYWKILPKTAFYVFIVLLLTTGTMAVRWKKSKEIKASVIEETPLQTDRITIDTRNFTKQQQKIISLFLEADGYRVNKEALKETLWPNHEKSTTNMTTAIGRLKDALEKSQYPYTINTFIDDESYYILEKYRNDN